MIRCRRSAAWGSAGLILPLLAGLALADGPGPALGEDGESPARSDIHGRRSRLDHARHLWPPRQVTGGPGYVGSDFGLGKPSFYGLGSRPDWGRSSVD